MESVLILGSGSQGLATVSALKRLGYKVILLCSEKNNYADKSNCIDILIYYSQYDNLLSIIKDLITKYRIKAILPMGDSDAIFLSKNKTNFENNLKLCIPCIDIFNKGYDKNKLMNLCKIKGYPHPNTIDMEIVELSDNNLKNFTYPALLKPNCTTGGRGMRIVNNYEELISIYDSLHKQFGSYHLQQFIKPGGKQVKIQLLVDEQSNLLCCSALQKIRWYPINGGSSSCSISIVDDDNIKMCHNILKDIGWQGFADFDLIEDPNTKKLLVMEINPRLPACIKGAIYAGINWPEAIVDYTTGRKIKKYNYINNRIVRHLGFEILWFIKSPNRFYSKISWFNFFGNNICYQDMNSWSDPFPFIYGTFNNIKKFIKQKK